MLSRLSSRVVAGATAAVLVGGSTLLIAGPASAAEFEPGDTEAVGAASQDVGFSIGDISFTAPDAAYGALATSVPGQGVYSAEDVELFGSVLANLRAKAVDTGVQSTATLSQAFATVNDTSFNVLGTSVIGLGVATAAVQCPVDSKPLAGLVVTGLTVFGVPITIDDDNPLYTDTVALGDAVQVSDDPTDVEDLSGIDLTVNVAQVRESNAFGAASIALAVSVSLEGTLGEGTPDEVAIPFTAAGRVVLAEAACLTPLSLTAISPASGPTAGGETVTLTGTGFPQDAVVTFGGVPATVVDVDLLGTSLTAVVPAHDAGAVDVTVATAGGQTATLQYTYVAPIVPVNPVTPASTGSTTLAATGADPVPTLGLGAGVLALGLGALLATAAVRRRRA